MTIAHRTPDEAFRPAEPHGASGEPVRGELHPHPPQAARGPGVEHQELEALRREHRRMAQEIAELGRELATARAQLATEREALRGEAERNRRDPHRQESLGALAGGLAHQFNNLLTIITGHVGLAQAEALPGTNLSHSLEEIRIASERAAMLCRQLLNAAGHTFAVRQNLDPRTLMTEALSQAGRSDDGTIMLEHTPSLLALPAVRGVAVQLQQALAALVQNAFEACAGRPAGRVRMALHDLPLDAQQAALLSTPVRPGRYICFEVTDNGCGIAPEALGRVFDPFYTTKGLGRGLGLAAAAGIARAHGGGISVESVVGSGSRFRLFLPVVAAATAGN